MRLVEFAKDPMAVLQVAHFGHEVEPGPKWKKGDKLWHRTADGRPKQVLVLDPSTSRESYRGGFRYYESGCCRVATRYRSYDVKQESLFPTLRDLIINAIEIAEYLEPHLRPGLKKVLSEIATGE